MSELLQQNEWNALNKEQQQDAVSKLLQELPSFILEKLYTEKPNLRADIENHITSPEATLGYADYGDVWGAVSNYLEKKNDVSETDTDEFSLTLDVSGVKIPKQSFNQANEFAVKDIVLLFLEHLKDVSTSIEFDLTTYKETQEKDAYKKDAINKLEHTIVSYTDKLKSLIFGVNSDNVGDFANIIYAYLAKNIEDFQTKFLPRLITQYITNTLDVTKHLDYVNSYEKKEYTSLVYKTLGTEQSFDKTFDTALTVFNGLYDRVASGELTKEEAFSYIIIYCTGLLDALREETGVVATPQVLWRMNNIALNMRKLLFTALETNDKSLLSDATSEKYGGKIRSMNTLKYEYIAELGINNIYTYVNKNKMELDALKLKLENSIRDVTKEGSIYNINNFKGLGALQAYIEDFKENILKEVYTVAHTTIPSAAFAKKTGVSGALINSKIDANKNIASEVENELNAILTVGVSLQDNVSKLKYILSSRALADLLRKSILSASDNKLATFKENGLGKATLDVLQRLQVKIPEDCITLIINLQKIYSLLNPHSVQSSVEDTTMDKFKKDATRFNLYADYDLSSDSYWELNKDEKIIAVKTVPSVEDALIAKGAWAYKIGDNVYIDTGHALLQKATITERRADLKYGIVIEGSEIVHEVDESEIIDDVSCLFK